MPKKYDKIYSVGCFDQFHYGHETLLKRMKEMGSVLVVGVHDNSSLQKLKSLKENEYDDHETRMSNVKKFADHVFLIASTDPTFYLKSVIGPHDNFGNSCFVRANDNIDFPGREYVESKISVEYVPYTVGISATQLRAQKRNVSVQLT